MLLQYCDNNDWEKAIKLCRYIKDKSLWAFVAAISLHHRNTETAEISLANIESIEKVQYITQTMNLPSEVSRQAALLLYFRKYDEAEQMFLQEKLYYRAIKMNIKLYRWDRAMNLVKKFKTHADTLLGYRERYMRSIDQDESHTDFLHLKKMIHEVDWEKIKAKIKEEKEKEVGK